MWQMGEATYVGRVGGLAVALGVGTAVMLGAGYGVAAADETGSTSSGSGASTSSGATSGPTKGEAKNDDSPLGAKPSTSDAPKANTTKVPKPEKHSSAKSGRDAGQSAPDPVTADPVKTGDEADGDAQADAVAVDQHSEAELVVGDDFSHTSKESSDRGKPARLPARLSATQSATQRLREVLEAKDVRSDGAGDIGVELGAADLPQERESQPVANVAPATVIVLDTVDPTPPGPDARSSRTEPNVVEVVVDAVSTIVGALFEPFSAGSGPGAPAAAPQLWSALAFARRELETAFQGPALAGAPMGVTSSAPLVAAATSVVTEATVAATTSVEPTLTYTAPPSVIDQFTVLGLRFLRTISTAIGVDLFAEFNKLMISNSPPRLMTLGLNARETEVELTDGTKWRVWEFTPPNPSGKTVVAIHGSGFIYEPNLMQWYDYTSMARDTGATVLVPLYPLATTEAGSALNVVPDMADYISQQIDVHGADNVSVYGDSAGSIIAIAAVRQLVLVGKPVPSSMVLLSLTPDGSLSNPDILTIDDPVIDVNNLGDYGDSHWRDGLDDPADPLYNALSFETLVGLPPTTIYVGSLEFVLPDTLLLYQRAVDEGAPISVVVGRGQIHDWALGGLPINSQAPVVRPDVYRQLGLVSGA